MEVVVSHGLVNTRRLQDPGGHLGRMTHDATTFNGRQIMQWRYNSGILVELPVIVHNRESIPRLLRVAQPLSSTSTSTSTSTSLSSSVETTNGSTRDVAATSLRQLLWTMASDPSMLQDPSEQEEDRTEREDLLPPSSSTGYSRYLDCDDWKVRGSPGKRDSDNQAHLSLCLRPSDPFSPSAVSGKCRLRGGSSFLLRVPKSSLQHKDCNTASKAVLHKRIPGRIEFNSPMDALFLMNGKGAPGTSTTSTRNSTTKEDSQQHEQEQDDPREVPIESLPNTSCLSRFPRDYWNHATSKKSSAAAAASSSS